MNRNRGSAVHYASSTASSLNACEGVAIPAPTWSAPTLSEVNRSAKVSTMAQCSDRLEGADETTRRPLGDERYRHQERARSTDRCGGSLPARQGNSVDDGVRSGRGCRGVAWLAVSALPRQGLAAGRRDRAPQRRVLVEGARDARAGRGPGSTDRRGHSARPHRLRRSRRAADETANRRARGIRGVRRRGRAGPGPRSGRLLVALSDRCARRR